jgi:hypothetical protein
MGVVQAQARPALLTPGIRTKRMTIRKKAVALLDDKIMMKALQPVMHCGKASVE